MQHFDFYNQENFERDYSLYFDVVKREKIQGSERIIYLMKRK
jgi:hypothetical protein